MNYKKPIDRLKQKHIQDRINRANSARPNEGDEYKPMESVSMSTLSGNKGISNIHARATNRLNSKIDKRLDDDPIERIEKAKEKAKLGIKVRKI